LHTKEIVIDLSLQKAYALQDGDIVFQGVSLLEKKVEIHTDIPTPIQTRKHKHSQLKQKNK